MKSGGWDGQVVFSGVPASHPCLSLVLRPPRSDAAWPLVSVGGLGTLMALPVTEVLWPTEALVWLGTTAGPGHGTLVSLFGNYTQDGWSSMVFGVSKRERAGKEPGEKPPPCPSNYEDRSGRKRGRR